jgi:regulator of protease activity HflC (stomatin/prohibitin superfamily)
MNKTNIEYVSGGCLTAFVIILLLLIFPLRPFVIISAGERGVVIKLGKVQDEILGERIYPIIPIITQVKKKNIRIQKTDIEEYVETKDLQRLTAKVSLNWHPSPEKVNKIYQNIGGSSEVNDILISPAIKEALKAATPKRNAEEILKQRDTLKLEIDKKIAERLGKYGVSVDEVSFTNLLFSDDYNKAIERKQIAEQDRETAKREAESAIERARGQAESQKLLKLSIDPLLLQKQAIEKWDGHFPTVMGSNGMLPLINIQPSQLSQSKH